MDRTEWYELLYVLNPDKTIRKATTGDKYSDIRNIENRRVAKDFIGESEISTVFLNLDHNHEEGDPILFETMVFGGELDQDCRRYRTWDEAVEGHARVVCEVKIAQQLAEPTNEEGGE